MKRILAIVVTTVLSLGLMAGVASAQDYVPDTPPTVSANNSQITFPDLTPGIEYTVAFFDAAGNPAGTVTGTAGANGELTVPIPAAAATVGLFVPGVDATGPISIPGSPGYTSVAAPQPPAPAPRVPVTVIQAPAATNIATGNIALARTSSPVSYTHLTLPTNREV